MSRLLGRQTNFALCLVCQEDNVFNQLRQTPVLQSYTKLFDSIVERANYNEDYFCAIISRLCGHTAQSLQDHSAKWHTKCYKNTVNAGFIKRSKKRFEKSRNIDSLQNVNKNIPDMIEAKASTSDQIPETNRLTRSQAVPFDNKICFFCDKGRSRLNMLHKVSFDKAGKRLKQAVNITKRDDLAVKLNTAINPEDAHAIDIRYHIGCWNTNVKSVLRKYDNEMQLKDIVQDASEMAADIEFLSLLETELKTGKILSLKTLHTTYQNIREENSVPYSKVQMKNVKRLIEEEIPCIEFHKPKRRNQAQRVSIKNARDFVINNSVDEADDIDEQYDLRYLFNAAVSLRKSILKATDKWEFKGSLKDFTHANVPDNLYHFTRWLIGGCAKSLSNDAIKTQIDKDTMSLCQSVLSMIKNDRQVINKKTVAMRQTLIVPRQVAVGISLHQITRSRKCVDLLHSFGLSIEYNKLSRIETQLAESVLKNMNENNGVFLPPYFVKGRHIFFAIDNVDFLEDTPDGKGTSHVTGLAMYQRVLPNDHISVLTLLEESHNRSLSVEALPDCMTKLIECSMPKSPKPLGIAHPKFQLSDSNPGLSSISARDKPWLLARTLPQEFLNKQKNSESNQDTITVLASNAVPAWSAYNSMVSEQTPLTRVSVAPLIAAPAHEWSTLLTTLKQAQGIYTHVVCPGKTVISLDIGLYVPAKQLQMHRNDLDNIILRPGELHTVMAMLRAIGTYIDNSGIEQFWVESGIFGNSTVRQIMDGKHVNRGVEAHLTMLQALHTLYIEAFLKENPHHEEEYLKLSNLVHDSCKEGDCSDVKVAHTEVLKSLEKSTFGDSLDKFEVQGCKQPLFKAAVQYMKMIVELSLFIRAVRTADWKLHLTSLESLVKYFFAHDKRNYARVIPLYLSEMSDLQETAPNIYEEFTSGNWIVNKNSTVPFCSIGGDHALEQVIRTLKVDGGLTGLTLNPGARARYFLIAPEMARLAKESQEIAGLNTFISARHHRDKKSILDRQNVNTQKLVETIKNYTNPFEDKSNELINFITKKVMPEEVMNDVLRRNEVGIQESSKFVSERITCNTVSVWAPMKNINLKMWKCASKKVLIKTKTEIIELRETSSLMMRMLVVARSRPELDLKQGIGNYEFSVVPRALFAVDGTLHHCSTKSNLMAILEGVGKKDTEEMETESAVQHSVAIIDGMAEVQSLPKTKDIKTCEQLAILFVNRLENKYCSFSEVHVIFDRYDIPSSLKSATRDGRQGGKPSVAYRISDNMPIENISLSQLLAHANTKHELTVYLATKVIKASENYERQTVVAWSDQIQTTKAPLEHLASPQEEADTKMILHAVDATSRGATQISIFSPDTDVFVLALRRYPQLCTRSLFVTGRGDRFRSIEIGLVYNGLGPERASALPGFHAFTGADNTGAFYGKGKLTCWKVFENAEAQVISAFTELGKTTELKECVTTGLELFVCQLYSPLTKLKETADLRWWMFNKKGCESSKLPPTKAALHQSILRAHHQSWIWNHDNIANPERLPPENYGWMLENDNSRDFQPRMTTLPPAPTAIIELVKCSCSKSRCASRCSCKSHGLRCTELCQCTTEDEDNTCLNSVPETLDDTSSDEDEDEDGPR